MLPIFEETVRWLDLYFVQTTISAHQILATILCKYPFSFILVNLIAQTNKVNKEDNNDWTQKFFYDTPEQLGARVLEK